MSEFTMDYYFLALIFFIISVIFFFLIVFFLKFYSLKVRRLKSELSYQTSYLDYVSDFRTTLELDLIRFINWCKKNEDGLLFFNGEILEGPILDIFNKSFYNLKLTQDISAEFEKALVVFDAHRMLINQKLTYKE